MIELLASAIFIRAGGLLLRVDDQPCKLEAVAAVLSPDAFDQFRSGMVYFRGMTLRMCWARSANGIVIVDEEGDAGDFELRSLKISHGA